MEDDVEQSLDVEVVERSAQEQRWKEFIHGTSDVDSKVLTFAVPLVNRKAQHVIRAVASIYARVRSMQIPSVRTQIVHKSSLELPFESGAWSLGRSLWRTMSPGDEPTQNVRVESRLHGLR